MLQHTTLHNATAHNIVKNVDLRINEDAKQYSIIINNLGTLIYQVLGGFTAPFDKNGVLYHIATRGGTEPYQNPHLSGAVSASMSSIYKVNDNY